MGQSFGSGHKSVHLWNDVTLYNDQTLTEPSVATKKPGTMKTLQPPFDLLTLKKALATLDIEQLRQVIEDLPTYERLVSRNLSAKHEGSSLQQGSETENVEPNRRSSHRFKGLLSGKILTNNKMSVMDCTIRNKSETGCGITVESTTGIPIHFILHILNGNVKRRCEVIWRQSNMMGVRFLD